MEVRVMEQLHKLKVRFMAAQCSRTREAFMLEGLAILESFLNSHEITVAFFMSALESVEQWDWEYQLREIHNLPEKHFPEK